MNLDDFFELNSWGLTDVASRQYARAAYRHDAAALAVMSKPVSWPSQLVDPCHLFACARPPGVGLSASRLALEYLLDQGAVLDAQDASGWVPLSYSGWFGFAGTLDLLMEAGACVHPKQGPPPLVAALSAVAQRKQSGSDTCARLLLLGGADPSLCSITETHGRTSFLSWALASGELSWAEVLWLRGDRLRNQKELALLTWQAGAEALDWLQEHDYDVLGCLPADHQHRDKLAMAQSARRRIRLTDIAMDVIGRSSFVLPDEDTRTAL